MVSISTPWCLEDKKRKKCEMTILFLRIKIGEKGSPRIKKLVVSLIPTSAATDTPATLASDCAHNGKSARYDIYDMCTSYAVCGM